MLTIWCVYWGDKYEKGYVQRLQSAVARNLSIPHRFKCLTDAHIDGVHTVRQISDKQGWWQKWDLFSFVGPALYLDLDVVITGDIAPMCYTDADIRTGLNWAMSGHNGCQSTAMFWNDARKLIDLYDESICGCWPPFSKPGTLYGDQEMLTKLRDNKQLEVDYFDSDHLVSYKYHCQNGLPNNARVVAFHGEPKPADVRDEWVRQAWQ